MERISEFFDNLRMPGILAVLLAGVVAVLSLWWGGINQDEGWYLYAAQLVGEGKLPYRDFFFTQGPAFPVVYSFLRPVWAPDSPLHGLLGGRVVTLAFGLLGTFAAMALVRRMVAPEKRTAAALSVFVLLAGNLYHVYFTVIPKTYALGSAFLLLGFLLLAVGLGVGRGLTPGIRGWRRVACLFVGGLSLAFSSGTRISLVLILPVVGFALLFRFRTFRWAFLWFGLGGALGLALTYGFFALDPQSLKGLLAAQAYHAARGGFDPFFALGSVSRLARGYVALGVVLFAGLCVSRTAAAEATSARGPISFFGLVLGLSFAAVFLLQLSAPFPYDDYQVPLMGLLTVLITTWFFNRADAPVRQAWFVVLVVGLAALSAPQLQQWMVYGQDRFWSLKKERTELSKLRFMAEEINLIDPGGSTLLTQDLYLAVESGRKVPEGLEMGPFSYFPDLSDDEAKAWHVHNTASLEDLLASAPSPVAAISGYAFAIGAPRCREVPFEQQKRLFRILKDHYEMVDSEPRFGQNATTLLVLRRKAESSKAPGGGK